MLPVLEIPSFVAGFVNGLGESYRTRTQMPRYVTGLMVSRNKTITGIRENFIGGRSSRSMNRFLIDPSWSDRNVNAKRVVELQRHNETRWSMRGVGIIDDSLVEKTGKLIPFSGTFYDHCEQRYVHAINLVTLQYADKKVNYPVDFSIYEKEENVKDEEAFATKIELAICLITEGIKTHKMPVRTFIFDSWYMSRKMTDAIESMGREWIGACKSNLLVKYRGEFMPLEEFAKQVPKGMWMQTQIEGGKYRVFTKTLFMKSLDKKVRIIISKDEEDHTIFLATNRRDFVVKIVVAYTLRWKIEQFYKDAKKHLGLEDCQVRDPGGVRKHFSMVFLSHTLLKLGVVEGVLAKACATIGKSIKSLLFQIFEKLVYEILEKKDKVSDMLKVLYPLK